MKFSKNVVHGRGYSVLHCPVVLLIILVFDSTAISGLEVIQVATLNELTNAWTLEGSNAKSYSNPGSFKPTLDPLNGGVTENEIWVEENVGAAFEERTYKYSGLLDSYCDLTDVKIQVRYFAENAVAYTDPCEDGLCYFNPPKDGKIEWLEETSNLDPEEVDANEVQMKMVILPTGYFLFDKITISFEGRIKPPRGCFTTTTEDITTTTDEETTEITTDGTTGTYDTEETNDETWGPLPTTTMMTTTTTTTRRTTTMEPITGTDEELPEDPTDETTTEDFTTETDWTTEQDSTDTDTSDTSDPTTSTPLVPPVIPPSTASPDDKSGFSTKEILLYFVLPACILLIVLVAATCYCAIRSHRLRVDNRFNRMQEEVPSNKENPNNNNLNKPPPTISVDGGSAAGINPYSNYIQSGYASNPPLHYSPSPSVFVPISSNNNLSADASQFSMKASPTFNRTNAFILPPSKSPVGSVYLNIPISIQNSNGIGPRSNSNRSSFNSSTYKYPLYTGDYTHGGDLPRMRRKLD